MKGLDKPPMHAVLGQLIEHSNWASRSWVDATMHALGEAICEASGRNGELARRDELAKTTANSDERQHLLLSALESEALDEELRLLGLRFLKLREQFRTIWSADHPQPARERRSTGRLVADHLRNYDIRF